MSTIEKFAQQYEEMHESLAKEVQALHEIRMGFPTKYTENAEFEEYTITASNLKHRAIQLFQSATALAKSVEIDVNYFTADILIIKAENHLKDHGFQKVTDSLREAAVAHNEPLKKLLKAQAKISALFEALRKLPGAFESDETNMRVFANYKHRSQGF